MDSTPQKNPGRVEKDKKKRPSPRRDGREAAVQFLFGRDLRGGIALGKDEITQFWELRTARSFARDFATELIEGTLENIGEIDALIKPALQNFSFYRLTPVDRNILRLGVYELLYAEHIPASAALNEAIEIARRFGTEDSPAFVNGVLDRILRESRDGVSDVK